MAEPFNPIPPERNEAFLLKAAEAVEESAQPLVDPAIESLGELVVREAETYQIDFAKENDRVADGADQYLLAHERFADDTEDFLRQHAQHMSNEIAGLNGEDVDTTEQIKDAVEAGKKAIETAGRYDAMATSRFNIQHDDTANRISLGGKGFGDFKRLSSQIGIQNQFWSTMADQNKPVNKPPQNQK